MQNQTDYSPLTLSRQLTSNTKALSVADLAMMMLHAVRCPDVYAEARRLLTLDLFDQQREGAFALLWAAIGQAEEQYRTVNQSLLGYICQSRLETDPSGLDAAGRDLLFRQDNSGLLYYCYSVPDAHLVPDLGRELLRKFLHERKIIRPTQSVLRNSNEQSYLRDLVPMLDAALATAREIDTIREAPLACVMPVRGAVLPMAPVCEPLGISWVDSRIGGQRKGDCNGILGVFGAGKTTAGIQLAVTMARNYNAAYVEWQKPRVSLFLSYEEPETKVNPRVWACASNIQRSRLELMLATQNWGLLTTQENILPYERQQATAGSVCLSETERWDLCAGWLNRHFIMLDMSGSEKYKGAGKGFVAEIRAILERAVAERNCEIGTVVIDYAGLVCRRYMESANINNDQLRHFLGRIGDQLRQQVAEYFGGTVWLLHQFNGEQNNSSSSKLLHHSDAAESKSFAENMAVCGCIGVRDRTTGVSMINWSKIRYAPQQTDDPPRVTIDGEFSRLLDVTSNFQVGPNGVGFIDPEAARALHDGPTTPSPGRLRRMLPTSPSVDVD